MKPLELIIYPSRGPEPRQIESGIGAVLRHRKQAAEDIIRAKSKRFTYAELAAEFHASCMDTRVSSDRSRNYPREDLLRDEYIRRLDQEITLYLFATLPDYDEVTP